MIQRRPIAVAVVLSVAACAHVGEDRDPARLTEQLVRDVCIPYVVDGIDAAEVGRRLGGGWGRELPDPFTPDPGPTFRGQGAMLQVIDGRQQRNQDGSLTSRPLRICNLWMGRHEKTAFDAAVVSAAASREGGLRTMPVGSDPTLRIVACLPMSAGKAVVRTSVYADGTLGAGVYQTAPDRTLAGCFD